MSDSYDHDYKAASCIDGDRINLVPPSDINTLTVYSSPHHALGNAAADQ